MDLIPRALVIGVFAPPTLPGQGVTPDQVNKIWADVSPGRYTQLQFAPDGSAAQFIGASPDVGMTIQHPLIQVRDQIALDPLQAVGQAQDLLKTVGRHLGLSQVFNLGIKLVYNAAMPDNDAKSFILNRVISRGGENVDELAVPGGDLFAGIKTVAGHPTGTYTLTMEPLLADQLRSLFLDLDAQFPGPTSVDAVRDKGAEVHAYMSGNVSRFLDRLLQSA